MCRYHEGNFGDALIACAGFTFMERAGLDFRGRLASMDGHGCPAVMERSLIVYPGGKVAPSVSFHFISFHSPQQLDNLRSYVSCFIIPHHRWLAGRMYEA